MLALPADVRRLRLIEAMPMGWHTLVGDMLLGANDARGAIAEYLADLAVSEPMRLPLTAAAA